MDKKIDDTFKMICDFTYGAIRVRNQELLDLSNKTNDVSFDEAIDFSITSNGISIIKSFFHKTSHSYSTALLLRNIIEDFALKEMNLKGDISKESCELLRYNGFIEDYFQYEKLTGDEYKKIIDYDKLVKDYKDSLSMYEKNGFRGKNVKKSDIPFLLNKNLTYKKIIKKYLPDYLNYYELLSYYIHPHNYRIEELNENVDRILTCVVLKLVDYYKKYVDNEDIHMFTKESKQLLGPIDNKSYSIPFQLLRHCEMENELISELCTVATKELGKNNYLVQLCKIMPNIIFDLCSDSIHSQTENCKMKFKTIIELFAVYDWLYFSNDISDDRFYLVNYYSLIKENDVYNKKDEHVYKDAYDVYSKIYANKGVDFDSFKNEFSKLLGFTINSEGKSMSINELIHDFTKKNFDGTIGDSDIKIYALLDIMYSEACAMGHGKCYSFFSNAGAFLDDCNVINFTDVMLISFLKKYNSILKILPKVRDTKELEDAIDEIIREIIIECNAKAKLMGKKRFGFDFKKMTFK